MALKLSKKAATATKTTTHKDQGKVISEETSQENVEIPEEVSPEISASPELCRVGFEASYTHNLGDFKSTRIAISLSVPCEYGEIDQIADYAETWVDGRLSKCVSDIVNGN
ncbi:MAG: hypothetical protein M9945_14330 [Aquamicrobium sp.]|uniref:hypothetical protein n=1 Tax=Aquamicrobium sp. TaxID=1872579 RepID=UPI00349E63CE|nr:hypothetical protein [Aquamicrobium sp.]